MRHFTYNGPKPIKQIASYCKTLETDINSLINYIDYFTPNYKILNYTPRLSTQYYSNADLIEEGYILPVQIIPHDDFIGKLFRDTEGNLKGESSLIVFPSYLKLHEGLLNRFPEYDHSRIGVLLYYNTFAELKASKQLEYDSTDNVYLLPDTILSMDLNKPQIQLEWELEDDSVVIDPTGITLEHIKDDNSSILYSGTQLSLATATETVSAYGPSLFQRFEPAHIIVSLAMTENDIDEPAAPEHTDPTNYLVCRFAAAGTYYYNNSFNTWTYAERATDLYGEHIVVTFATTQLRYYTKQQTDWPADSFMQFYDAYQYKNNNYEFFIQNQQGAVWNSQILSHQLVCQNENTSSHSFDTFICDDTSEISLANIDSHRIPRYTINIEKANTWSMTNVQTVLW